MSDVVWRVERRLSPVVPSPEGKLWRVVRSYSTQFFTSEKEALDFTADGDVLEVWTLDDARKVARTEVSFNA